MLWAGEATVDQLDDLKRIFALEPPGPPPIGLAFSRFNKSPHTEAISFRRHRKNI